MTVNDTAWDKMLAKPNGTIGGSVQLTAEGSPGTTPSRLDLDAAEAGISVATRSSLGPA